MRMVAVPNSAFTCFSRSRICAWMVTSSAVVGSSAMSTEGAVVRPIAIIARCRMPPDSSWG